MAALALFDWSARVRATTQTSTWIGTLSQSWSNPSNWTPANTDPNDGNDGFDFDVLIPSATNGPTVDVSATIDNLTLNPGAVLHIQSGEELIVNGPTLLDNGSVVIGSSNPTTATLLVPTTTLSGSGAITLSSPAGSELEGSFTQSSGHTIMGAGSIVGEINNAGTINANVSGQNLLMTQPFQSSGLVEATSGGTLSLQGISVTQQASGQISAAAGTVVLSQDTTISGGTLSSSVGGTIQQDLGNVTLTGITNNAIYDMNAGASLAINNSLVNNGTINVNSTSGSASETVTISGTLSGSGAINLVGGPSSSVVTGAFTEMPGAAILGAGEIQANLTNKGTVDVDVAGGTMVIGSAVTNVGMLDATLGTLYIDGVAVNNTGGTILANGGEVLFAPNASISGGTLKTSGGGAIITGADGDTLSNVTIAANSTVEQPAGTLLTIAGTIINNGNMIVSYNNPSATLGDKDIEADLYNSGPTTISGSGTLTFDLGGAGSDLVVQSTLTMSGSMTTSGPGILSITGSGPLVIAAPQTFPTGTALSISATVNIPAGGSITTSGADQMVGSSGVGTLTLSGGAFSASDGLQIGEFGGSGYLNVGPSSTLTASIIYVGNSVDGAASNGTVVQNGGQVSVAGIVMAPGYNDTTSDYAKYTLQGGTLSTGSIVGESGGSSAFYLNGGVLQATANNDDFITGVQTVQVVAGAIIDTNGFNITISEALTQGTGAGDFTKLGAGTLSLTASNTFTGVTTVSAGTLKLVEQTLPSSAASIASGAVLEYNETATIGQGPITFTGDGILRATGSGNLVFGAGGTVNVDFGSGALIDVEQGELTASSSYCGDLDNNESSLNVAPGALFDTVEGGQDSRVVVDALTGAGTVQGGYYLNGPTTLTIGIEGGSGTFSGVLQNDQMTALAIVKQGGGTETLSGKSTYTGGTTVSGGSLVIGAASALPDAALTINQRGRVQLLSGIGGATITSLAIANQGSLDLGNNHLFIDYAGQGADPIGSIIALIRAGYAGGSWSGSGITSIAVLANPSYGIGFADSADAGNPAALPTETIEIKYTLLGDANLDGKVNGTDFAILAANFNQAVTSWDEGDFNYDGKVNGTDFALLASNFNQGASQADTEALYAFAAAHGLLADVPEPGSLALVAAAGVLCPKRRRR